MSEIGDVNRFASADKLCAWAGLTPSEHSNADNVRRGHISKQGSRWLRWVMVEAAVHAFRDVELRQLFVRIAPTITSNAAVNLGVVIEVRRRT